MSSVPSASLMNLSSSITNIVLQFCKSRGELPEQVFRLPQLQALYLHGNNLTEALPRSNWSSPLETLDLSSSSFTGQIPRSLFNLEQLTRLDLSLNNFVGILPDYSPHDMPEYPVRNFPIKLEVLNLSHNLLNGTIPPWLFALPSLSDVDTSNNFISGEIGRISFREVGNDSVFYLDLSNNLLSKIELLPQVNLMFLDLLSNLLTGSLPSLSPILQVFFASKNQFEGVIPSAICKMTDLAVLDLSYNNLRGGIPRCLELNFLNSVSVLDLRESKLHCTIPAICANPNSLRSLNLNENKLGGLLPRSLVHCKNLEVLDLGNNILNDTFPHWLETLPNLRVLVLRPNEFYGYIENPKSKFPFRELRIMDLSYSKFSAALPIKYFDDFKAMMNVEKVKMGYMGETYYQDSVRVTIKGLYVELVKIQTILTAIDFSSNNFTGEIPDLIGRLKSLKGPNFSHNMLGGTIPSTLANLTNLEWLDLSSNQLVRKIPIQLADLTSLAYLNLSHNQLEGAIPPGNQFNTFDNSSFSGNLGLCGFPLSKTCSGDADSVNQPSPPTVVKQEGDTSNTKALDWKIVLMGNGSGLVIGISMGYILLYSDRKLSWLCERFVEEL